MATFSAASFSRHTFSTNYVEPAVVGSSLRRHGVRYKRFFRIGDKEFSIDDDNRLEWVIEQEITKPQTKPYRPRRLPVNLEPKGGLVTLPAIELPSVNWAAVSVIRRRADRQGAQEVIVALDRVIQRIKDDEDEAYWLLM